jgi:hypothetical protein
MGRTYVTRVNFFYATHFLDHILFFEKYSTNADTHTRISIHPYEHTRTPYPL